MDDSHDDNEVVHGAMALFPSMSNMINSSMVADDTPQSSLYSSYMQQSLALASRTKRLISGFAAVLDRINNDSGAILFCILPENLWYDKSNVGFFSLFLASCYNSGVRMIKVDQDQLVRKIIDASSDPMSKEPRPRILSYECMAVIDYGPERATCDEVLLNFCKLGPLQKDFERLPMINLID